MEGAFPTPLCCEGRMLRGMLAWGASNFERPYLGRIAGTRAEKWLKMLLRGTSFWFQPQIYLKKIEKIEILAKIRPPFFPNLATVVSSFETGGRPLSWPLSWPAEGAAA